MTVTTSLLPDGRGAARMDELFDTDPADLWRACTEPERLARWIAQVTVPADGRLGVGATVQTVWTSSWSGEVRIERCEPPRHLLLTTQPGTDEQGRTELWLTAEGDRTRLVIEDSGIPADELRYHGAGWQVHLDDLARALREDGALHPDGWSAERPAEDWHRRWRALTR